MTRLSFGVAVGVLALAGSLVSAQAPKVRGRRRRSAATATAKPAGVAQGHGAAQVLQIMQNFSAALGVTCNHCHVFIGPNNPMNDFAATPSRPRTSRGR